MHCLRNCIGATKSCKCLLSCSVLGNKVVTAHRNNSDNFFNLQFGLVDISLCKCALGLGAFSQQIFIRK